MILQGKVWPRQTKRLRMDEREKKNPPPVTKSKKSPSIERLACTEDRLELDIKHTVEATNPKVVKAASGRAIPLCLPNDCEFDKQTNHCKKLRVARSNLVINKEAITVLQSITDPVCVIAIVGPCRTGKSYILSQLIDSDRDSQPCFKLGHLQDPETMGIWMWDTPIRYQLKDGRNISIILLDTEGTDAYNSQERGDTQVFTLSVLLSSLLIYNSPGVPKREDLSKMTFIAKLANSIRSKGDRNLNGNEVKQIAPGFFWLLRDALLKPTDRSGQPCHFRDFLLEKVLSKDDNDIWGDTDTIQFKAAHFLLHFFTDFDAEMIPPPSTSSEVMENIEDPKYKDKISPEFIQQVEYVRTKIFEKCEPKRGYTTGSLLNGIHLAGMLQIYVDALNSPEGIPEVSSAWDQVMTNTYQIATAKAIEVYKSKMSDLTFPMEDGELKRIHQEATEKVFECFQQLTWLDADGDVYSYHLSQLSESLSRFSETNECTGGLLLSYLEQNVNASEKDCQSLVHSLKSKYLSPIIENLSPETDTEDIVYAIKKIDTEYHQTAKGPAKLKVFEEFMKDFEDEQRRHSVQLPKLKKYYAELKTRNDELQKQRSIYQQKVTEKNNLESRIHDQNVQVQALEKKIAETKKRMKDELEKKDREHLKRIAALQQVRRDHEKRVSLEETHNKEDYEDSEHKNIKPMYSKLHFAKCLLTSLWTQFKKTNPGVTPSAMEHMMYRM